jgi:hypothetical protein
MEADLLVLADLAEVGYADCQVCERPEGNNEGEMILVQTLDDVESLVRDAFYITKSVPHRSDRASMGLPVCTLEAAQNTPNIVLQPDLRFSTLACTIWYMHCRIMSLASGFALCTMAYSKGFKKSFWKLKFANSCFSKKRIASCRRESRAKKETFALV